MQIEGAEKDGARAFWSPFKVYEVIPVPEFFGIPTPNLNPSPKRSRNPGMEIKNIGYEIVTIKLSPTQMTIN